MDDATGTVTGLGPSDEARVVLARPLRIYILLARTHLLLHLGLASTYLHTTSIVSKAPDDGHLQARDTAAGCGPAAPGHALTLLLLRSLGAYCTHLISMT